MYLRDNCVSKINDRICLNSKYNTYGMIYFKNPIYMQVLKNTINSSICDTLKKKDQVCNRKNRCNLWYQGGLPSPSKCCLS